MIIGINSISNHKSTNNIYLWNSLFVSSGLFPHSCLKYYWFPFVKSILFILVSLLFLNSPHHWFESPFPFLLVTSFFKISFGRLLLKNIIWLLDYKRHFRNIGQEQWPNWFDRLLFTLNIWSCRWFCGLDLQVCWG